VFVHMRVAHRLQILQVEMLIAEAIDAYNAGELLPQVTAALTRYPSTHYFFSL